jgi:hypothetical protein
LSGHRFYCFQQKQNNFNKHLQLWLHFKNSL